MPRPRRRRLRSPGLIGESAAFSSVVPLLALLFGVLLCGFQAIELYQSRYDEVSRAEASAGNLRRLLESRLVGMFREVELVLIAVEGGVNTRWVERLSARDPNDRARLEQVLRYYSGRLPQAGQVGVVSPDGRLLALDHYGKVWTADVSDRDYLRIMRDDPSIKVYYSRPMFSRIDKRYIVTIVRRIHTADGHFAGLLLSDIGISYIEDMLSSTDYGPHGVVALRDTALDVVARYPAARVRGTPGNHPMVEQMATGQPSGVFRFRSINDGEMRLYSWGWLPGMPYVLAVGLSERDYLTDWHGRILVAGAAGAILAVLGSGIFLLYRRDRRRHAALLEHQKRLRASEARFRRLVNAMPTPVIVTRPDARRVLFANPPSAELLTAGDGDPDHRQLRLDEVERVWLVEKVGEAGDVAGREMPLTRPDGEAMWVLVSASAILFDDGPALLIGINDITARRALEERLQALATTDTLTGIANRGSLLERGEGLLQLAMRHQRPLSVLMLDIDHFKRINDSHGHHIGDEAIRATVRCCIDTLRASDVPGRLGGEEFAIVMPETSLTDAVLVAERLRVAVGKQAIALDGIAPLHLTVSIGVASHDPARPETFAAMLIRADLALYAAKNNGRDRVEVAD